MMKKCLLTVLALLLALTAVLPAALAEITVPDVELLPKPVPETEAMAFVHAMKVGINLGNGFDANDCGWLKNELEYESAWTGAKITEATLDSIRDAGIKTVRLPVSWHNHVSNDGSYTISEPWLARVQEVVDWCLARDLYVILNIHHDNSTSFMYPSAQYREQSLAYVTAIWQQLADRFVDYGDHLVFESLNEPRMVGHRNEWWIDNGSRECKEAIQIINELNQAFVDTVRATGGNNATRYLSVPGYDASPEGVLNAGFVLPTDPNAENDHHILLSVHAYTPYNFALEMPGRKNWSIDSTANRGEVATFMEQLYNRYVVNGQPVLMTEFGALNKDGNTQDRTDFTTFYIAAARARGITCVWWDNNNYKGSGEQFGIIGRQTGIWIYPSIRDALVKYAD